MAVDLDVVEFHALAFQRVENKILHRPEGIFQERWRTQPVLIADHDEAEVRMAAQEAEGTDNTRTNFSFSRLSTCSSEGSWQIVPSRSISNTR